MPTIVTLGDSLTAGYGLSLDQAYPAVLERTLHERGLMFDVVNHGISGDSTADALARLDSSLSKQPEILIVALGANDGLRGVAVAQVRANLATIIERAQAQQAAVLLCGMDAFPIYGWDYTRRFHLLFPELAKTYRVPLVPLLLQGVVGVQSMLLPDNLHPNAAGAAQIARVVWPYLYPIAARVATSPTPPR